MNRKEFAEKRREMTEHSIDELIDLLASEDLQTRFFAEMCLRDATYLIEFQACEKRGKRGKKPSKNGAIGGRNAKEYLRNAGNGAQHNSKITCCIKT